MPKDISFINGNQGFSYRVAGFLIQDNKILVQRPYEETDYAFPGGQVSFNETNEETLIREFKEELNLEITVNKLKLVGEVFFFHRDINWSQISLYYLVSFKNQNSSIPLNGCFPGVELNAQGKPKLEFSWIPIENLDKEQIYPLETRQYLKALTDEVIHFISYNN